MLNAYDPEALACSIATFYAHHGNRQALELFARNDLDMNLPKLRNKFPHRRALEPDDVWSLLALALHQGWPQRNVNIERTPEGGSKPAPEVESPYEVIRKRTMRDLDRSGRELNRGNHQLQQLFAEPNEEIVDSVEETLCGTTVAPFLSDDFDSMLANAGYDTKMVDFMRATVVDGRTRAQTAEYLGWSRAEVDRVAKAVERKRSKTATALEKYR